MSIAALSFARRYICWSFDRIKHLVRPVATAPGLRYPLPELSERTRRRVNIGVNDVDSYFGLSALNIMQGLCNHGAPPIHPVRIAWWFRGRSTSVSAGGRVNSSLGTRDQPAAGTALAPELATIGVTHHNPEPAIGFEPMNYFRPADLQRIRRASLKILDDERRSGQIMAQYAVTNLTHLDQQETRRWKASL